MSPHEVTLAALKELGVSLSECHFTKLKGHQQYVDLKFTGSRKLKSMHARADHAISFCLQARSKFYCTRGYLQRCRDIEAEIGQTQVPANQKSDVRRNRNHYLN